MNDNSKPVSNTFAVCWCMCEVGAFIGGIVAAIMFKEQKYLLISLAAFAMLMGGV